MKRNLALADFRSRAQLCGLAFITVLSAGATAQAGRPIHLEDFQNYANGAYGAYASPWSTFTDKNLVHGVGYQDTIEVSPTTFPDHTVLNWRWPEHVSQKTGVWGYIHVFLGNYDGGKPPVPTHPRQVAAIHILREELDLTYNGHPDFNLLNEFYLTQKAGDAAAKLIEIGYFLHASPQGKAFFDQAKAIGPYRDEAGRIWDVRMVDHYCMLIPADNRDLLKGTIDIKATLAFLQSKGVIKGDEWFNGIAVGSEPIRGAGRLEVRHWKVVYN